MTTDQAVRAREQFQAHIRDEKAPHTANLERWPAGDYRDEEIFRRWRTWQTALALREEALERAARRIEELNFERGEPLRADKIAEILREELLK